ncbi:MAG TPA: WbqC family protein [Bacteroidales bacterium]|nr:WbqC family protein [Bacteroidales bacterium]HOH23331.1 WbqC family protein [Bacteroidales bacterium]HPZ04364.1 WbqC family protein [Bacteroidales bacterium]
MLHVILTSIAYMPPVEFFVNLKGASAIWVEQHENYQKQTYRNRAQIYSPNGVQNLIIPVQRSIHTKIKDTLIDNRTPWQRNHWRSITAAYNNSPYFLYYKDAIEPFFTESWDSLFQFNFQLLQTFIKILNIDTPLYLTESYEPHPVDQLDLREDWQLNCKKDSQTTFQNTPYNQVFIDKFGFIPNLSILDLICCEGPYAPHLLCEGRR